MCFGDCLNHVFKPQQLHPPCVCAGRERLHPHAARHGGMGADDGRLHGQQRHERGRIGRDDLAGFRRQLAVGGHSAYRRGCAHVGDFVDRSVREPAFYRIQRPFAAVFDASTAVEALDEWLFDGRFKLCAVRQQISKPGTTAAQQHEQDAFLAGNTGLTWVAWMGAVCWASRWRIRCLCTGGWVLRVSCPCWGFCVL